MGAALVTLPLDVQPESSLLSMYALAATPETLGHSDLLQPC